jgi:hypothetical protein
MLKKGDLIKLKYDCTLYGPQSVSPGRSGDIGVVIKDETDKWKANVRFFNGDIAYISSFGFGAEIERVKDRPDLGPYKVIDNESFDALAADLAED